MAAVALVAGLAVEDGCMRVACAIERDELVCEVSAPTSGWVAVGFNRPNAGLNGARLVMGRVQGGGAVLEVHVCRPPEHHRRAATGAPDRLRALPVSRRAPSAAGGGTTLRWAIPLAAAAPDDVALVPGAAVELILAFSSDGDFQHHSAFRRHHQVRLPTLAVS